LHQTAETIRTSPAAVPSDVAAYRVDDVVRLSQDGVMADGITGRSRPPWLFMIIGGVVGAALGVVVAVTSDIPLAPEIGLVVGLVVGWGVSRTRR
jgi:hypothetical protein